MHMGDSYWKRRNGWKVYLGKLGLGGGEEDERVRMLAAGCLVRIREVVEKYQALLMGDMASFQH